MPVDRTQEEHQASKRTPVSSGNPRRKSDAGNYFVTWVAWTGASLAGIALGNLIPTTWGLGFAGVLCLVGILCSLANTPLRVLAAVVAGAAAVAA